MPGGCGPRRNGQKGQTSAQQGGTGRTGPNKAEQGRTKAEHIGSRRNKKGILASITERYLSQNDSYTMLLSHNRMLLSHSDSFFLMGGTRQNKAEQRRNKAEQNQTWQNRRNKAKQRRNCSALFVPKARILQSDCYQLQLFHGLVLHPAKSFFYVGIVHLPRSHSLTPHLWKWPKIKPPWPHRHKPSAAASKSPSHQPPVTRYSRIPSSAIAAAIWWPEIRLIVVYLPFLSIVVAAISR